MAQGTFRSTQHGRDGDKAMIPLSAAQISKILSAQKISGDREKVVESVTIDSRTASRGDCFFAIIGGRLDGHDFACQALSGSG